VAVAEELHFRRAAERLHIAQPAVSEQVRKLEVELGVRLFERTQRNVALTYAGAVFLDEARGVLRQAELARMLARGARDRASFRLRIGYVPAMLPASVPRALERLAAGISSLETSLQSGSSLKLIEAVCAERLDAAIVAMPVSAAGLRVTALGKQRALAALPVGHRQAVSPVIHLDQMAPERLVVLPREANRPFYDAVLAACRDAGIAPALVEMPDADLESALLAVASGAGMALLPEAVAERYAAPGVRFVPLAGDQPALTAAVVSRRDSAHMPTAAFLRALSRATRPRAPLTSQTSLAAAA
jgi:DNA-binding transcriptional LysR family regulator